MMRTIAVAAIVLLGGETAVADPNGFPALSAKQLKAIMPKLTDARADTFLKLLNDAMKEFEINTPKRQAAFLAQVAHESSELKYMEETMVAATDGRPDLGNTKPGDGSRYKGRGPLQLTGRANYRSAGQALKLDLENQPELVAKPEVGSRVAGWFWKAGGFNMLADQGDFRNISLAHQRRQQRAGAAAAVLQEGQGGAGGAELIQPVLVTPRPESARGALSPERSLADSGRGVSRVPVALDAGGNITILDPANPRADSMTTATAASPATKYETRLYINGQWCAADSGRTLGVINPATEEIIAEVAFGGRARRVAPSRPPRRP